MEPAARESLESAECAPAGHAFLCHATEDRPLAERVYDLLRREGLPAWICSRDIPGSAKWDLAIARAIESCGVLVFLCTENAVKADWVRDELREARDAQRPILPVLIGGADLAAAKDLRLIIGGRQWLELGGRPNDEELLSRLLPAVRAAAAGGPAPELPRPRPRRAPWVVGAGVGVVTLGGALLALTLGDEPPPPAFDVVVQAHMKKMGVADYFDVDENLGELIPPESSLQFLTKPKLPRGSIYLLYVGPDGAVTLDPADASQQWQYRSGDSPGTVTALALHSQRPLSSEAVEGLKKKVRASGPPPALPVGVNIRWTASGAHYVEDPSRSGLPTPEFPRSWTSSVLSELRTLGVHFAGRSFPIGVEPRR